MNPYNTPKIAPPGQDLSFVRRSPPSIVTIAVVALAASYFSAIAKTVYFAYQRGDLRLDAIGPPIGVGILVCILSGICYLLLRGLYRGSKLAFWIIVAQTVLSVIFYRSTVNWLVGSHAQWEKCLFISQGIIQFLSAAALLFPQSWAWFHEKKSKAEQDAPSDGDTHPV